MYLKILMLMFLITDYENLFVFMVGAAESE